MRGRPGSSAGCSDGKEPGFRGWGDGLFQRIRIKGFSDGEADQPAVTALNQHPDGIGVKISAGGKHLQNGLIGKGAGLAAG